MITIKKKKAVIESRVRTKLLGIAYLSPTVSDKNTVKTVITKIIESGKGDMCYLHCNTQDVV